MRDLEFLPIAYRRASVRRRLTRRGGWVTVVLAACVSGRLIALAVGRTAAHGHPGQQKITDLYASQTSDAHPKYGQAAGAGSLDTPRESEKNIAHYAPERNGTDSTSSGEWLRRMFGQMLTAASMCAPDLHVSKYAGGTGSGGTIRTDVAKSAFGRTD